MIGPEGCLVRLFPLGFQAILLSSHESSDILPTIEEVGRIGRELRAGPASIVAPGPLPEPDPVLVADGAFTVLAVYLAPPSVHS